MTDPTYHRTVCIITILCTCIGMGLAHVAWGEITERNGLILNGERYE